MSKILFCLVVSAATSLPAVAADYDLVINNGRVMDPETMFDAVANVGIKGGSIAVITEDEINGKQTIDATGKIVSPGFIDLHSHGLNIGDYRLQAVQGVTTALELESGVLPIGEFYKGQATPVGLTCARVMAAWLPRRAGL